MTNVMLAVLWIALIVGCLITLDKDTTPKWLRILLWSILVFDIGNLVIQIWYA